jgi:hypothetical protein
VGECEIHPLLSLTIPRRHTLDILRGGATAGLLVPRLIVRRVPGSHRVWFLRDTGIVRPRSFLAG